MKNLEVWTDEDVRVADRKSGLNNVGQADGDGGRINRILEKNTLLLKPICFWTFWLVFNLKDLLVIDVFEWQDYLRAQRLKNTDKHKLNILQSLL